ncbi:MULTISPECIES: DUF4192 domain-containing protein [Amycolatopsis]|uniref:DUF4192 domain-containing protein n=1 Tax=Amycolatopsis dendrobii TaxID=2760662 RepID=A0A7W3VVC4_9PSEU|nr:MULTISPECIES: DUF4192 domain-containing protein [Amycolatopsis]MBB1153709.1 DUF4192 domain-containing protein [Amycolatopsis dendrobii]UKD55553.1 DUF4192 domain-containing protein [Amycolatopsis sp. FU40]
MTTSTPPGISRATLSNPADLIASLPYLLGFRPEESLVLLGHRVPGTTIGLMLRADLPPRELQAQQAEALIPRFDDPEHNGVTAVIVGGSADEHGPPHRTLAAELERCLARHNLRLFHGLWTPEVERGAPWSCYRDPDCCGVLPDPRETVLAAATTEAGFVVFRSREELAAVLEPRSPEAIARRAALLESAPEPLCGPGRSASDVLDAAVTELRAAFLRHRRGEGPPDDDQAVRLAHALMLTPIRDACLALAVPPHTSLTREAEEVWLTLVRELPPPHRAEAALYLGYTALMRGEGALAGMALANAVEADPEHLVAQLLQTAWNIGTDPVKLTGLADLSTAADLGLSPPPEPGKEEPGAGRRSGPPRG